MTVVRDERAKHLRQVGRLRRSARRWSVLAGGLFGASVVVVPYHGLGWPDAIWAGLTGGAAAVTWWRWSDHRTLARLPVPDPPPRLAGDDDRWESLVARLPVGRNAVAELRRYRVKARLRGSSVAPAWNRLDRAAATLAELSPRLVGSAAGALAEATAAERSLRDLGERAATVERALGLAADDQLSRAHAHLLAHFTEGVDAYERLVAAAAGYVAQDGRMADTPATIGGLRDAADLLSGIASGLSEFGERGTTVREHDTA